MAAVPVYPESSETTACRPTTAPHFLDRKDPPSGSAGQSLGQTRVARHPQSDEARPRVAEVIAHQEVVPLGDRRGADAEDRHI